MVCILDFISTLRSWVNACFSKLHLGRVIYSNSTASNGTGEGRGLRGVSLRSLPPRAVGYFLRHRNQQQQLTRRRRGVLGDI